MEETKRLLTEARQELRSTRRRLTALAALTAAAIIAAVIVGTVVITSATTTAQQAKSAADSAQRANDAAQHTIDDLGQAMDCIEHWANASARRGKALTPFANARIEHLFAAFRAALHHHQDRALRLAKRAIREDRRYLRAARRNPVPQPRLACRITLPAESPEPHATATRTVTAPAPAPSTVRATVTVTAPPRVIPGPTRTVTRTVTVPPGKRGKP